MPIDVYEEHRQLQAFCDAADHLLDAPDDVLYTIHADESAWSPAQHLQHTFIASGSMLKAAQMIGEGNEAVSPEGEPNRIGQIVLRAERMARKKAEAPAPTRPPSVPSRDALSASLDRTRRKLDDMEEMLDDLPGATGRLEHPFLGTLSATQWLRVARIHAEHHLSIIRDLIRDGHDAD